MKKLVTFAACVAFLAAQAAPVFACAEAWEDTAAFVPVHREDVLIVWDKEAGLQHLVRRIAFGETKGLGFIVPVPSVPQVAEADEGVFGRLDSAAAPVKIPVPGPTSILRFILPTLWQNLGDIITGSAMTLGSAEDDGVRVLREGRVAGQTYALLQAVDIEGLQRWLTANGYKLRPDLGPWLKKYVDAKWTFAAFKYDGAPQTSLTTRAIRLSFRTSAPFFPYREPEDQQKAAAGTARLLRVYFVAPTRVQGKVGGADWAGTPEFARSIGKLPDLLQGASPAPSGKAWLTIFNDRSSPRPATDELFFSDAAPKPLFEWELDWRPLIPVEPLALALLILFIRRKWRGKTVKSPS